MSAWSSMKRKHREYIPDAYAEALVDHFELEAARAERRRWVRAPALALLLSALWLACSPVCVPRDGWSQSGAAPAHAAEVLQAAAEVAPCPIQPWGGHVDWVTDPFLCSSTLAAGCYSGCGDLTVMGLPGFTSALDSALGHELAHHVEVECFGDTSESARRVALTQAINARAAELALQ